jgi:hypothetical protein
MALASLSSLLSSYRYSDFVFYRLGERVGEGEDREESAMDGGGGCSDFEKLLLIHVLKALVWTTKCKKAKSSRII